MVRGNRKRERQTDRHSDVDVALHSSHNESNRDAPIPSPNRQQDVHDPSPITDGCYFKKLRKWEEYSASSFTS